MEGKKILIGVCGGIAAYKISSLVRLFVKAGAEVKIIMTESAKSFITPLTLSTLSKKPVSSYFMNAETGEWENHVELGLWPDVMLIAPATSNTLAKCAYGLSDNLLVATYLSAKCPVVVAPAMDLDMYSHPCTQNNFSILRNRFVHIIDSGYGELASGLVGKGRMSEPEEIFDYFEKFFATEKRFLGKKILITAGPTFEKIDPVRFIGNRSSGKMGLSIAEAFASQGAEVEIIAGPGVPDIGTAKIRYTSVESADQMFEVAKSKYADCQIAVFAAAVADYKPVNTFPQKLKKASDSLNIELVKNKDIAYEMGKLKKSNQLNIGFALETEHEHKYAKQKMEKKNFDAIVLNSLNDTGAGFSHDTNKITIFSHQNEPAFFELKSKEKVASDILNAIYELL